MIANGNGWLRILIGLLIALIMGSYAYGHVQRAELESRLVRIEQKIDCALGLQGTGCGQYFMKRDRHDGS